MTMTAMSASAVVTKAVSRPPMTSVSFAVISPTSDPAYFSAAPKRPIACVRPMTVPMKPSTGIAQMKPRSTV